jgi:hypothetical protein
MLLNRAGQAIFKSVSSLSSVSSRLVSTSSQLENGISLISNDNGESLTSLTLNLAIGSRQETEETRGAAWLTESMAFKHTQSRSFLRLTRDLENAGMVVSTSASREHIGYHLTFPRGQDNLQQALKALVETLVTPRLAHWEVKEDALSVMQARCEEHFSNPQTLLSDAFHAVTLGGFDSPLGRSVMVNHPGNLTVDALKTYLYSNLNNQSVALVGSGVSHDELEAAVSDEDVLLHTVEFSGSPSDGQGTMDQDSSAVLRVPSATEDGLVHVAVGGQVPLSSKDTLGAMFATSLLSLQLKHMDGDKNTNVVSSGFSTSYSDVKLVGCYGVTSADALESSTKALHHALTAVPSQEMLNAAVNITKMKVLDMLQTPTSSSPFLATLSDQERSVVSNGNSEQLTAHLKACADNWTTSLSGMHMKIATVGEQSTQSTTSWLK